MSAQPVAPNTAPVTPPDMVNVEVDGRAMQVKKGSMIIQATDAAKAAAGCIASCIASSTARAARKTSTS